MPLSFGTILHNEGLDPAGALVIRHAYAQHTTGGLPGLRPESTAEEILAYTAEQSVNSSLFPAVPPPLWIVFIREGGQRARLWSAVRNNGLRTSDGVHRWFDLTHSDVLGDLHDRLVIHWPSPRTWRVKASTAAKYPVLEISDSHPVPFPGFDRLIINHAELQAVVTDRRHATWRTALSSVQGVYLITDTRDGRHYVGKADGAENVLQRWKAYASTGHGGNVDLKGLDPSSFRYSLLRVFDPATPQSVINGAENHFKRALDTRAHGLNRN